jgi:hypothetical protein
MNNSKFDILIQDMQKHRMTSDEKTDVYNRALSAIESIESTHENLLHVHKPVQSTFVSAWTTYIHERKFVPTLIMASLLLVTGGTSLFAESALPGDYLYSLKLNVNEEIQGLVAVTPEAKAKFTLEVTDKRLKEVALLSSQGKLDESTRKIIEVELAKQAGQMQNQVASLVAVQNIKAAQEVATNYESSLKTHELILQKISSTQASTSDLSTHIDSIISTVQTELATSTESRMTLQNSELTLDSNNKEKVEKKFTESKHKFDDLNSLISTSKLSGKTSTVISAYIAQTNQYITDAEYLFKQEQFPLALAKLQQVDQLVSDAEAIVNADVSTSVALKFIVNEAFSNATTTFDIKADIIATSTATTTLDIPSATSTEASSTTN